ncbi:MAG: biotin synthase BioB, partial [Nitrososphaeraceae archaeon]
NDLYTLAHCSNAITRKFNGDVVDVETLINAKSGGCPEDCSFCAQSSKLLLSQRKNNSSQSE